MSQKAFELRRFDKSSCRFNNLLDNRANRRAGISCKACTPWWPMTNWLTPAY